MGKNGRFGKDYGKVAGKDSPSRPGWRGPGYTKKASSSSSSSSKAAVSSPTKAADHNTIATNLPLELQQLLLNIFKDSFPVLLLAPETELQPLLQEIKTALYERDFGRAFGDEKFLEAYAVRWSPGRALCYAAILGELRGHLLDVFAPKGVTSSSKESGEELDESDGPRESKLQPRSVCFGGGAAEVVAFGGFLRVLHETVNGGSAVPKDIAESLDDLALSDDKDRDTVEIDLILLDVAAWDTVVQKLSTSLSTPPPLSKYASQSATDGNAPLITQQAMTTTFHAKDVLGLAKSEMEEIIGTEPVLLTLLFTLNELYTTSLGKTTQFLLNLTSVAPVGSLLLVVDSPGSYSETKVGLEAKKYPMKWLLDHTLLGEAEEATPKWEKVVSEDSRWCRLQDELRYPIPLEDMRYQVHLYRRV